MRYSDTPDDMPITVPVDARADQSGSGQPGLPRNQLQQMHILVVNSARFSNVVIAKILARAGHADVRYTSDPLDALRSLEKRPADVLISDWSMSAMNGLELARRVRSIEPAARHHTHIVLLTGNEDSDHLGAALSAGVDDFISKNQVRSLLASRIQSAQRLTQRQNSLLAENAALKKQINDLQTTDVIDPITGLGNMKFTEARIADLTRDVEARGGAACLLLVGIRNLETIRAQHDDEALDELISGFAAKVRNFVRPLDVVTRPEPGILAIAMRQPSLANCTSHSFKRVFDNLYMHSFKTSQGYIPVEVGVSICGADESTGLPDPINYMRAAYAALTDSYHTGLITVAKYSKNQAAAHFALWA